MRTIMANVGSGGINRSADVSIIQQLLYEAAAELTPLRPAQVTGTCDQATKQLISEFQRRVVRMNPPSGRVEPGSPTLFTLNRMCGPVPPAPAANRIDLETALSELKTEAGNFGQRFIQDQRVRAGYIRETEFVAKTLRDEVQALRLTPQEAAIEANKIRNSIMESARLQSSDIGRAQAEALKQTGKTLAELEEHYARKLFNKSFGSLTQSDKNRVWMEIVEASGRPRPTMNAKSARMARLGRAFVLLSVGIAVYNVATAENKGRQVVKEGATAGAGVLGGMAGGAAAGAVCGPGAPACVVVGVFVGGALAAFGVDVTFDWLW